MADLLVNLLKIAQSDSDLDRLQTSGIIIRRAHPFELTQVREFVKKNFSVRWADEISVGFNHKPVSVFIAISEGSIVGFAAYECTSRGFFGPTGVMKTFQHRGIGKALLLAALSGLREMGYVYAIIGGVGPVEFYEKAVGAIPIPDSDPGIYTDLLI